MRKAFNQKLVLLALAGALVLTTLNCGYILYPERKGQAKGDFDIPVLIMDCLWFIPGVIPGAVALIVDFTTGCIYEPATAVPKKKTGDDLQLRMRGKAPAEADLQVSLRGPGGYAVLLDRHYAQGEEQFGTVSATLPEQIAPGNYQLILSVNGIENAAWPIEIVQ